LVRQIPRGLSQRAGDICRHPGRMLRLHCRSRPATLAPARCAALPTRPRDPG
jgi:hypothetical protein